MRRHYFPVIFALVLIVTQALPAASPPRLLIHEWGTFTELQNAQGVSVGGVNTDDEPVPAFVHQLAPRLLQPTHEPWRNPRRQVSKALAWNADVTMRLETPVIYFYLPEDAQRPVKLDVHVQLRGGWLSEYYPQAIPLAPGLKQRKLHAELAGALTWNGLHVGAGETPVATKAPVWLAPRNVAAEIVSTPSGEAERYLFYRGVGRFAGPLRAKTLAENRLELVSRFHVLDMEEKLSIRKLWLVSIDRQGDVAYRSMSDVLCPADRAQAVAQLPRTFHPADHTSSGYEDLREDMHQALVADGLFADEATAMLTTWDRAYFRSPGLRLFYLVPHQWTEDRMPLDVSRPHDRVRVMMGRIELITDHQRALLAKLNRLPPTSRSWLKSIPQSPARDRFFQGDNEAIAELGVKLPASYQAYLELGRFRNALIHNALMTDGTPQLAEFARQQGILSAPAKAAVERRMSIQAETKAPPAKSTAAL